MTISDAVREAITRVLNSDDETVGYEHGSYVLDTAVELTGIVTNSSITAGIDFEVGASIDEDVRCTAEHLVAIHKLLEVAVRIRCEEHVSADDLEWYLECIKEIKSQNMDRRQNEVMHEIMQSPEFLKHIDENVASDNGTIVAVPASDPMFDKLRAIQEAQDIAPQIDRLCEDL